MENEREREESGMNRIIELSSGNPWDYNEREWDENSIQ